MRRDHELSTKEKYNRNARRYDLMEMFPERFLFGRFRRSLWSQISGDSILEVGVGTGKNIPHYPKNTHITAIDFSDKMLKYARKRANKTHADVDFEFMDVQALAFPDNRFDTVVATFVFCSVPDPILGLKEIRRVLKPNGRFYALEHVRPKGKMLGSMFDRLAPAVVRHTGVHINRNTVKNIQTAGFAIELEKNLLFDIFKMIVAS